MSNKRFTAKEFFEGIDKGTEKNDATRVERKHEDNVPAKNGYQRKTDTTILHSGDNAHDASVRENRRVDDALYHGKFMRGDTQEAYDEAARRYNEEYDAKNDYSKALWREQWGVGPKEKISNGDDMRVLEATRKAKDNPSLKNINKVHDAKKIRDEHSKQRAAQFESGLHKYDKNRGFTLTDKEINTAPEKIRRVDNEFDKMDTKKNPGGWAKSFFRDLHDKEVK